MDDIQLESALQTMSQTAVQHLSQAMANKDDLEQRDRTIFKFCAKYVAGWSDSEFATVEPICGGGSGAILLKVQVTLGRAAENVPSCKPWVVLRLDPEVDMANPMAVLMADMLPGKWLNLSLKAHQAWSHLPSVPMLHYPQSSLPDGESMVPGVAVMEFLEGDTLGNTNDIMDTPEDAAAWGMALAQLHAADDGWYSEATSSRKLGGIESLLQRHADVFDKSEAGKELASMCQQVGNEPLIIFCGTSQWTLPSEELQGTLLRCIVEGAKLLDPSTLMGRLVIGHGDMQSANLVRRAKGTLGDVVIVDFDRVSRMAAAIDFGTPLGNWEATGTPYPSLQIRRVAAQAYIDALGEKAAGFQQSSVDEVLFDAEIGSLMRRCFRAFFVGKFCQPFALPYAEALVANICELIELLSAAQQDEGLQREVLEKGAASMRPMPSRLSLIGV